MSEPPGRVVNRLVDARKEVPEGKFRHLPHILVEYVAHCNLQVEYYKEIVSLAINQTDKKTNGSITKTNGNQHEGDLPQRIYKAPNSYPFCT
jgi:hypothetical protein